MAQAFDFRVNLDQLERTAGLFRKRDFPALVARAMDVTTQKVLPAIQQETERNFDLKSAWVPKQIQRFPKTGGQKRKIRNDVKFKRKFNASVFTTERINFMTIHEKGGTRRPTKGQKNLSIPGKGIKKYSFKTGTGKTRKRWLPRTLLKNYSKNQQATTKNSRKRKQPFIINTKRGKKLVRRKTIKAKGLEVLYNFRASAKIKRRWGFVDTGHRVVKDTYKKAFKQVAKEINMKHYNRKYSKNGK